MPIPSIYNIFDCYSIGIKNKDWLKDHDTFQMWAKLHDISHIKPYPLVIGSIDISGVSRLSQNQYSINIYQDCNERLLLHLIVKYITGQEAK